MAINKFNSKDGYSISDPPVDLIDNIGNYTTTTGDINAVDGVYTGDVSASHFYGDFIGEIQVACKNTSGSIIPTGYPVYITGTVGATNVLEVSPADAGNSAKMPAVGITSTSIGVNQTGHVTILGVVQSMNTSGYSIGQTLYVAVGGGLTNVKPTGATQLIQNIGRVGRVNANNGEIIVSGSGRTNDVPNIIPNNAIWNGQKIETLYGGTGLNSYITGDLLYSSSTDTLNKLAIGTNGTVLTSSGTAPQWTASTGTGNIVRATSPTLVTPNIGSATATSITGTTLNINDNTTNTTVIGAFTDSTTNISIDNSLGFINISEFGGGGINIDSATIVNIGDISNTGEYIIIDPSSYNISTGSMGITTSSLNSNSINCSTAENDTIISTSGVATLTTTATTQVNLLTVSRGSYRSAKFLIQAVNTTSGKYQITEINAIHNGGTTVASATINDSNIGGSNATYTVDAVSTAGGQFRLRVTPSSTQSTTFKVFYTAILL